MKSLSWMLVKLEEPEMSKKFLAFDVGGTTIKYAVIDEQPVSLAIALIVPTKADQVHLRLLSKLARKLVDHDYAEGLRRSAHDAAQLTKQVQQALAE